MLKVRVANIEDAQAIYQLSQLLGYAATEPEQSRQRLLSLLHSDADFVWVCSTNAQALGWLHVFKAQRLASSAFLEIGGLIVSQHARQQGVGRALVQVAIDEARSQGLALRVRCNTKRLDSHAFYRNIGLLESKSQAVFEIE